MSHSLLYTAGMVHEGKSNFEEGCGVRYQTWWCFFFSRDEFTSSQPGVHARGLEESFLGNMHCLYIRIHWCLACEIFCLVKCIVHCDALFTVQPLFATIRNLVILEVMQSRMKNSLIT